MARHPRDVDAAAGVGMAVQTAQRNRKRQLSLGRLFRLIGGLGLACVAACNPAPSEAVAASAYEEDATPESLPSFALRWLFGVGMGKRVSDGQMQLYYDEPVTEAQARSTARFLRRFGIAEREGLVQIRRSPAGKANAATPSYEVRISTPYTRREHIDRETRAALQLLALSAEGAVFDGEPVHLYVCNSMLQPLVILRPRLKPLSP
jgi:hypothetical protein